MARTRKAGWTQKMDVSDRRRRELEKVQRQGLQAAAVSIDSPYPCEIRIGSCFDVLEDQWGQCDLVIVTPMFGRQYVAEVVRMAALAERLMCDTGVFVLQVDSRWRKLYEDKVDAYFGLNVGEQQKKLIDLNIRWLGDDTIRYGGTQHGLIGEHHLVDRKGIALVYGRNQAYYPLYRSNVWFNPKRDKSIHKDQTPYGFYAYYYHLLTEIGGRVCELTAGFGTGACMAKVMNRAYVGAEIDNARGNTARLLLKEAPDPLMLTEIERLATNPPTAPCQECEGSGFVHRRLSTPGAPELVSRRRQRAVDVDPATPSFDTSPTAEPTDQYRHPDAEDLFRDILELKIERGLERVASCDLVDLLVAKPDSLWAVSSGKGNWRYRKLDQFRLAQMLRPHGIGARRMWVGGVHLRGYDLTDSIWPEVWARYCPSECCGHCVSAEAVAGYSPGDNPFRR